MIYDYSQANLNNMKTICDEWSFSIEKEIISSTIKKSFDSE